MHRSMCIFFYYFLSEQLLTLKFDWKLCFIVNLWMIIIFHCSKKCLAFWNGCLALIHSEVARRERPLAPLCLAHSILVVCLNLNWLAQFVPSFVWCKNIYSSSGPFFYGWNLNFSSLSAYFFFVYVKINISN